MADGGATRRTGRGAYTVLTTDQPPREGYCKATSGDYCAVQFYKDGRARWQLGEVVAVTQQHSRVKSMSTRTGELVKVGPHDRIRVALIRKLNKQRALEQLLASPEVGFATWEEAREHLMPALLREGETSGSIKRHDPPDS